MTKSAPSRAASVSGVRISRPGQLEAVQHPAGEAADDLGAVRIGVEEDQLVDRQAIRADRDPLDQLRRVGAAAADDRDLDAHRPESLRLRPDRCDRRLRP